MDTWMIEETKSSVLVVDDEPMNITALSHILSPDYTVYVAKDGYDALDVAQEMRPDIILLDILMPGINGYEVLAKLKELPDTKDIPVIFVSGLNDVADEEKGISLGAADYIHKPFRSPSVKIRVQNQLIINEQRNIINHLSTIDNLTNTANRRFFNTRLSQEWQRAVRDNAPLSILFLDMDNFKKHNAEYGHRQGDITLQIVADVINYTLRRPFDIAGRWGGEEFAILLPNTSEEGARNVAETIRGNIETKPIPRPEGGYIYVTASIGLNTIETPKYDNSMIFRFVTDAERALLKAKNTGRNRVVGVGELEEE